MIQLKYASLEYTLSGCTVRFEDGASWSSIPQPWTDHYRVVSHRCGYGDDMLAYCREHEAAHLIITERLHDCPSPVLWGLAHGQEVGPHAAAFEEIAAQALQRFLRAGERPIVGGVRWDDIRAYALAKLDPERNG